MLDVGDVAFVMLDTLDLLYLVVKPRFFHLLREVEVRVRSLLCVYVSAWQERIAGRGSAPSGRKR